ncbi:4-hydroxyphenylacetate 3-monooxygenase [Deinobacterium chartae]|uniref:4-hydroxyphenylacetate 3-monooxygenase n=1 Tax=Deinobacterium chartae TaxID=521158 RepID=A0A841I4Z9_9DEIO|nr:4-hydroxyphenylacetate 3-monooxygenase, oxygenase component [Deinobacterium chartae]MBB6099032.1 4-hydroxyphenylacetate 3-monooxygenase [Deinobacterium chartae]
MGARTGSEFLEGLRKNPPNLYIDGVRVTDPTTHPATRNVAHSIARLYDLQHDPQLQDVLTYEENGQRYGMSFLIPRSKEDLRRRAAMHKAWADDCLGFMGRTPDYLNVNLMAAAMAAEYFNRCEGSGEPGSGRNYGENMRRYYEFVREHDLCLTHALTNPQVNRSVGASQLPDPYIALGIVRETEEGVVMRGARMMATLPIADEILIFPSTVLKENEDKSKYAMAFAIPTSTPGLYFQCREPLDIGRDPEDHPLGARYDEQDAFVIFDDVLVPWERIFLLYDVKLANQAYGQTGAVLHMAHQVVCGKIAKTEALLGAAQSIVNAIGSGVFQHVQQKVSEFIVTLEILRALEIAAVEGATPNAYGVMTPARGPLDAARNYYPQVYPRLNELIQLLGASGIIMMPTRADREGPMGPHIAKYLQAGNASAEERLRLFRLAWDMTLSSFGARQNLYEKHFFGDPVRMQCALYEIYDKQPFVDRIHAFLERSAESAVAAD